MYRNKIRIISGQWRRRQIEFPDGEGLRPTPDRLRETLFNWLGQELTGLNCLDLFAGSGALGFEAASRGAIKVTMIELSRSAYQALQANKQVLSASSTQIINSDARQFLSRDAQLYDVIFVDPPFASSLASEILPLLLNRLTPDGLVYLECNTLPDLAGWQIHRQGKAGQVQYLLLKKG